MKQQPVVLVVEDNPALSNILTLLLGEAGLEVVSASNGCEGLDKCKAAKPDLVISDLLMPELDVLEMIKALRADPACREVPIIAFTAYDEELGASAIEAGADSVIGKTDNPNVLLNIVRGLLLSDK